MVCHGVAQFARIDAAHREHERRRLRNALFVAVVHRCARTVGDVAVARTVDDALGENRFATLLRVDDYALHGVALHDDVGCEGVHQQVDAALLDNLECQMLRTFGVNHREADVERTCAVVRSQSLCLQTLDELQRQTLDDDVAFASEEAEQRQTDGHVAAEDAAALDKHYFGAFLQGGCLCSHKSRRTCAYDEYVYFGANRNFGCRNRNGFHIIKILESLKFLRSLNFSFIRGMLRWRAVPSVLRLHRPATVSRPLRVRCGQPFRQPRRVPCRWT